MSVCVCIYMYMYHPTGKCSVYILCISTPTCTSDEYALRSRFSASNDLSGSPPLSQTAAVSSRDPPASHPDSLSKEGFLPATVKPKADHISYTTPASSAPAASKPLATSLATSPAAGSVAPAASSPAWTQADMRHDNTPVVGSIHGSSPSEVSSGYTAGRREDGGGVGRRGLGGNRGDGVENTNKVSLRQNSGHDRDWQRGGFSVDSIHNRRSGQTEDDYERQLAELREQLAKMGEEKMKLQQDKERVLAQWQGRVRRLEAKLKGEGVEV